MRQSNSRTVGRPAVSEACPEPVEGVEPSDGGTACGERSRTVGRSDSRTVLLPYCLTVLLVCAGCTAPRVVLPEQGAPLRAGPSIRGHVYVWTSNHAWELSDNEIKIPEGWYIWNPEGTNGLTRPK